MGDCESCANYNDGYCLAKGKYLPVDVDGCEDDYEPIEEEKK